MTDHYKGVPKSVRIGCYRFAIEIGDLDDHISDASFGHVNLISQKIRLRPHLSPENLANTFIHEVIHGIHWFLNAGDNITADSDSNDIEEEFTLLGANGLCMFWQDNPAAVAWWASCLGGGK